MKHLLHTAILLMAAAMVFVGAGCEKVVMGEETVDETQPSGNVIIRASLFNIVPFSDTRTVKDIADYASRLSFVFYKDGAKVKAVSQKKGDSDYGQAAVSLVPGDYQLLILAHSCPYGTPTLSDPSFIQFKNKDTGYSDTFFYYGTLSVTGEQQNVELQLQRAASMFSITINDEIPQQVTNILVQYKGESGVLDATTGYGGSVNSEQYINFNVEGLSAPLTLRVYTFLREDEGLLKTVNVIATNAEGLRVAAKEFTNVPMRHCMATEYVGRFFSQESDLTFSLTAETAWQVAGQYAY